MDMTENKALSVIEQGKLSPLNESMSHIDYQIRGLRSVRMDQCRNCLNANMIVTFLLPNQEAKVKDMIKK